MKRAVLLIDHGSRRSAAHQQLIELRDQLRQHLSQQPPAPHIEIAHMEIAEPSIEKGVLACVQWGAEEITALPCFLSRGRHVSEDIPELLKQAVAKHSGLRLKIAAPLCELPGFIPLLASAID